MYAAERGKVEALELLLSKGANIEATNEVILYFIPLHLKYLNN
jgi:ankyrin repeat protein